MNKIKARMKRLHRSAQQKLTPFENPNYEISEEDKKKLDDKKIVAMLEAQERKQRKPNRIERRNYVRTNNSAADRKKSGNPKPTESGASPAETSIEPS